MFIRISTQRYRELKQYHKGVSNIFRAKQILWEVKICAKMCHSRDKTRDVTWRTICPLIGRIGRARARFHGPIVLLTFDLEASLRSFSPSFQPVRRKGDRAGEILNGRYVTCYGSHDWHAPKKPAVWRKSLFDHLDLSSEQNSSPW